SAFTVKLIKDESKNIKYFIVKNKKNSLCELKHLSSIRYHFKKCTVYSEFMVGERCCVREI
ncbi:hypothetical protein FocTR4_00001369, partial [Fusarium oxysporum f. sp. cubense]